MIYNNNKWFTSIALLLLFWAVTAFLVLSFNVIENSLYNVDNYTDKTRSINNSKFWLDDWESFYYANNNLFYNVNDKSPCDTIWSVRNYANYNVNSFVLSETLHFKDIWDDKIWKENLKDDQWFINRICSLYSKWLPNKKQSDFSVKWPGSSLWPVYNWKTDNEWYYNIWKIYDNEWFWYFFTKEQIWEDEISINLDYNFSQFTWIDSLNIYDTNLKEKILLLKKNDPTLKVTKSNLKDILTDSLFVYDDANLEIWVVEFDWTFNVTDWFQIDKNTGTILEGTHTNWTINLWVKKWRLLCDWANKTCELWNLPLKNNKVYFFYIKSFEKPTTYHVDITDKVWSSISIPSNNLTLENFWYSNGVLFKNSRVVDIWKKGGYFSDFSSIIYNYVFFSSN